MEKSKMIAKVCEADMSDDKKTFLIDSILNEKLCIDDDFIIQPFGTFCYISSNQDVAIYRINFSKKLIITVDEKYYSMRRISEIAFAESTIDILREVRFPISSTTAFIKQDDICYLYDSVNVLPFMKFVFNDDYVMQYYSYVGSVNTETAHILNLLNMKHNTNQKNYISFVDYFLSKVYFHTSEPIMNIVTIIISIDNQILIYYNSGNRELYTLFDKELQHNNYLIPYNPVGLWPPQKEQNPVGLRPPQQKQKIAFCDMFDSSVVVKDKHLKRFAKYVKSEIKRSNSNKVQFTLDKYETKHYKDWLQNLCANKGYKIKSKKDIDSYTTDVTIRLY